MAMRQGGRDKIEHFRTRIKFQRVATIFDPLSPAVLLYATPVVLGRFQNGYEKPQQAISDAAPGAHFGTCERGTQPQRPKRRLV